MMYHIIAEIFNWKKFHSTSLVMKLKMLKILTCQKFLKCLATRCSSRCRSTVLSVSPSPFTTPWPSPLTTSSSSSYCCILIHHQVQKGIHSFLCHVWKERQELGDEPSSKPLLPAGALGCGKNALIGVFVLGMKEAMWCALIRRRTTKVNRSYASSPLTSPAFSFASARMP